MKEKMLVCETKECPLLINNKKDGSTKFEVCKQKECVSYKNGKCLRFDNDVHYLSIIEHNEEVIKEFMKSDEPNCNNCKKPKDCPYNRKWGDDCIWWCYAYINEKEEEK